MKNLFNRKKPTIWALIMVCAFCCTVGAFRLTLNNELVPTSAAKKALPIYCVDTGSAKKVAVSFDAAWGACRLRSNFFT